jgi:hypothetical protein
MVFFSWQISCKGFSNVIPAVTMLWSVTTDGFTGLFGTERDYILHFTVAHTY